MTKLCPKCNTVKNFSEFSKDNRRADRLFYTCKTCANAYSKNRYESDKKRFCEDSKRRHNLDKSKHKNSCLKKSYGIDLFQYKELLARQGGVCAICLQKENIIDSRTKEFKQLSVDHDHVSGKVRGLLCHNCNRAIGLLKDDVNKLQRALEYLRD